MQGKAREGLVDDEKGMVIDVESVWNLLGETLSCMREGIFVYLVVVVVLMVVVGMVVLMVVVGVVLLMIVLGVVCLGAMEVDCSGVIDTLCWVGLFW